MSTMWEVDPETKSKLLALQKEPANSTCVDCSAPAPQWATPKFGTFICLDCAGIHRGLGVHVSFVRSIVMDSFKVSEVKRMESGGNAAWRDFWDAHPQGGNGDKSKWGRTDVRNRYDSDVGEEWKERLSAKVEGREYVAVEKKKVRPAQTQTASVKKGAGPTAMSGSRSNSTASSSRRTGPGSSVRSESPATSVGTAAVSSRKDQNEAYFARMGEANSSRPEGVAPSQGGKYAGFGSSYAPPSRDDGGLPGVDDFSKDPVAALTKGFGWFTTTVAKNAKSVNDGWVQPGLQKLAETDLASQARLHADSLAKNVTKSTGAVTSLATEQFTRFVEGDAHHPSGQADPPKREFWDSFGEPATSNAKPEKADFWESFGQPSQKSAGLGRALGGIGEAFTGGDGVTRSSSTKRSGALGTMAVKRGDGAGEDWKDDEW